MTNGGKKAKRPIDVDSDNAAVSVTAPKTDREPRPSGNGRKQTNSSSAYRAAITQNGLDPLSRNVAGSGIDSQVNDNIFKNS